MNIDRLNGRVYCLNFSPWRYVLLKPYFDAWGSRVHLCRDLDDAFAHGLDADASILIYGIKRYEDAEQFAQKYGVPLMRMEDGFIRSVTLGSSFTRPSSIVLDGRGLYFDPRAPSDLEMLLQHHPFDDALLARAHALRERVVASRFSKYNHLAHADLSIDRSRYDKVILVIGQVEDDMSVRYGAYGLNNRDLLEIVRQRNPHAYIIYKPHPDVISGNRIGHLPDDFVRALADDVQEEISVDSCIQASDEVHTLTSTVGFDALLRGKKVYTYGMPFYAGWGLTEDHRTCSRRTRTLTLDALVAAALILYPQYFSPKSLKPCEPEQVLEELEELQRKYFTHTWYRHYVDTKGYLLPKIRKGLRFFERLIKSK
jgi:capsular polysaccharide export protein